MLNPYEIRLQLLQMSRELLEHEFVAEKEAAFETFRAENGQFQSGRGNGPSSLAMPDFPTSEKIIEKANQLKAFIDTN